MDDAEFPVHGPVAFRAVLLLAIASPTANIHVDELDWRQGVARLFGSTGHARCGSTLGIQPIRQVDEAVHIAEWQSRLE
jgi:hypothetical protein